VRCRAAAPCPARQFLFRSSSKKKKEEEGAEFHPPKACSDDT
jgi:hypothetical protein